MAEIDHWHPLISGRELRRKPVAVRLLGHDLVLFRTDTGEVGALEDMCPHRRSKLSTGTVVGDRLRCQYHAWTFDLKGNGESPATPKMRACAASYETREAFGYVWVRARGSNVPFPEFDVAGFTRIGELRHLLPAPLELALDNFTEIEHTTINHHTFGHDLGDIAGVTVRTEATPERVLVNTVGPTKRINWIKRLFFGAWRGFHFHGHSYTAFSPVHVRFDHWWASPDNTRQGLVRWRIFIFFVPEDADNTRVISFMYAKSRWPGASLGWPLIRAFYMHETDREIRRDINLVSNLADKSVGLEGLKLSRFDKVMGLTRDRIERVYRGKPERAARGTETCAPELVKLGEAQPPRACLE